MERDYRAKKSAGFFKQPKPFVLQSSGLKFDVDSIIFWVFFLSLFRPVFARTALNSGNIYAAAKPHLALDSSMTPQEISSGVCDEILLRFAALAESNSAFGARAEAVLSQQDFNIICTNQKWFTSKGVLGFAAFIPVLNGMVIAHDDFEDVDLTHEMVHAYEHYLHTGTSNCQTAPEAINSADSHAPVYPINQENIKLYEKYADFGDERIRRIYNIYHKEKAGYKLTSDESAALLRAKQEFVNVTPLVDIITLNAEALKFFKAQGWPQKKELIFENDNIYAIKVVTANGMQKLKFRYTNPIASIMKSLDAYAFQKSRNGFMSKAHEIGERLAYSQQCLTRKARRYLYPELTQFLKEQKAFCRPDVKGGEGRLEL